MEKEVKRPSVWATRLEVWKFKRNHSYVIPPEHHLNMIEFKGCSKETLALYLECCHVISGEALQILLKDKNTEMLHFIAEHATDLLLSPENEKAFIAKFGCEILLKNHICLSENGTLKFLQGKSFSSIPSAYLNYLTFSPQNEACLLKLKNPKLACEYLSEHIVNADNRRLVLLYDNPEVFKAYGQRNYFDELFADIVKTKSLEIFEIALKNLSSLSFEDEKLLIDRNDPAFIAAFIEQANFSDDAIAYLVQHASDEMFEAYVKHWNFPFDSCDDLIYQRLFEPRHIELLKAHLKEFVIPGKFEVRLLESGNKELIELYFSAEIPLSPETKAWLFEHPQSEYVANILQYIDNLGVLGETKLFQSGDDPKIKNYLEEHSLNLISETAFFKFASPHLLIDYCSSYNPCGPAQIALIRRKDVDVALWKQLWDNDFWDFDGGALRIFLNEADDDTILAYFQYCEDNYEDFSLEPDDSESACSLPLSEILYHRNLAKSAMFFISKASLSDADECALALYGSKELIQKYLKDNDFDSEAEMLLLCRGDKELVRQYISKYEIYDENQCYLFNFDDWDLIKFYQDKHGFSDNDIVEALED